MNIKYWHSRNPETVGVRLYLAKDFQNMTDKVARGKVRNGFTVCLISENIDGKEYSALGIAQCSKKDQFNKKVGRLISYGRALKELNRIKSRLGV